MRIIPIVLAALALAGAGCAPVERPPTPAPPAPPAETMPPQAALTVPPDRAPRAPVDMPVEVSGPARKLLDYVNEVRAARGLGRLEADKRLMDAAQAHSEAMARRGFFSHTAPDGSSLTGRLNKVRYPFRFAAENLSAGTSSAVETVDGWMLSDGHRRNLLDPVMQRAGIGFVAADGTAYRYYWTLVLARHANAPRRAER